MKIQHIHGLPPLYTNTFLITTDAGRTSDRSVPVSSVP